MGLQAIHCDPKARLQPGTLLAPSRACRICTSCRPGVRWNAVPIVVIGEHACPEWSLWEKPGRPLSAKLPRLTSDPELGRGPAFLGARVVHLEEQHLAFWPVLADSMHRNRCAAWSFSQNYTGDCTERACDPASVAKMLETAFYAP